MGARVRATALAVVLTVFGGLMGAVPAALVTSTPAGAATITSTGPLTAVTTSPDLNCAVNHVDDTAGEFYGDTGCGTFATLAITSEGEPATVTAGANALRIITVTNTGEGTANGISVAFTLPPGTTLVRTTPSQGTCGAVVSSVVTCALGSLAGGASANVRFVVGTPTVIPPGGTITTSASAQEGEGEPVGPAESTTTLTPPTPGAASGYVPPGGTLSTGGDATAGNNTVTSLSIPNTGLGAVVTLTSVPCAPGVCLGKTVFWNDFPGYDDPTKPIKVVTTYDKSVAGHLGLLAPESVLKEGDTVYRVIPPCAKPGERKAAALARFLLGLVFGGRSNVASPSPCSNKKDKLSNGDLRYESLFLSGDPGKRR